MKVEIWSDIVCPWCYLGKRRFEKALAAFPHRDEVEVEYRSFELDPSKTPGTTEPTSDVLARRYRMTPEQVRESQRQMTERAAAEGLAFRMDALRTGNTRDAHRLLHLAKARGRQAELAERLHHAYFCEEGSPFDPMALAGYAADVGIDRDEAATVLAGDDYADAVAEDEATAHALGATGVPFFVIDRRFGISGAQPAEVIARALDRAWSATTPA
jgi:predicted DsbA family dithiol-disulfide isomerase